MELSQKHFVDRAVAFNPGVALYDNLMRRFFQTHPQTYKRVALVVKGDPISNVVFVNPPNYQVRVVRARPVGHPHSMVQFLP